MAGGTRYVDDLRVADAPTDASHATRKDYVDAQISGNRELYWHRDWPEGLAQGGNTIQYRLWFPRAATVSRITVSMSTVNTQGDYTLTVTNLGTTNTMLSGVNYDMNGLGADTVTVVPLTGTPADLDLAQDGVMLISLASNNASFDGDGIYIAVAAG